MPSQEESKARAGAGDSQRPRKAVRPNERGGEAYRRDGPGKVGLTSDEQPDLMSRSGVNERDHGAADDKPIGGGSVNLDEILSDRNGPSDPDNRKK